MYEPDSATAGRPYNGAEKTRAARGEPRHGARRDETTAEGRDAIYRLASQDRRATDPQRTQATAARTPRRRPPRWETASTALAAARE